MAPADEYAPFHEHATERHTSNRRSTLTRAATPWPPQSGWELARPIRALGELLMFTYRVLGAILAVTPVPRITVAAAMLIKRIAAPILLRFPGMILVSGLVGAIL